jgi:hypothetical protein
MLREALEIECGIAGVPAGVHSNGHFTKAERVPGPE